MVIVVLQQIVIVSTSKLSIVDAVAVKIAIAVRYLRYLKILLWLNMDQFTKLQY